MTPAQLMEIACDRVGLAYSSLIYRDRSRQYLNIVGADVFAAARWNWRFKSSTFATVASQRNYSLAADVLEPLSFRDTTNNRVLLLVDQSDIDLRDTDADETGSPAAVSLRGINSTTGYWDVDLFPTPTAVLTIAYRYYSQWVELTSTSDDTDLLPTMPAYVQPALIHGVAALYYEEKGDMNSSVRESERKASVIEAALVRNAMQPADRHERMQRVGANGWGWGFQVEEGSLH